MFTKKNIIFKVVGITILLCIVSVYISSFFLATSKYTIADEKLSSPIRIVQLSDLHNSEFGTDNEKLISKIEEQQPDLIFLTGDLINYDEVNLDIATNLIQSLSDIAPVYFSYGNHEKDYEVITETDIAPVFEEAGAVVLDKEYVDVEVYNQRIRIGGVYGYCLPIEFEDSQGFDQEEYAFLAEFHDTEDYKVLLSHLPMPWIDYGFTEVWSVDSVFTGHLHGGQVRIPFVGGVYAPEFGWFPGKVSGLYDEAGTDVILSRGLGSTGKIPRFNNIPEIVVVDIVPE